MPTYTFAKVERYAEKTTKCVCCGKRLRRRTTLSQTLNPFNKNAQGEPKSRAEIVAELDVQAEEWQDAPEWCKPCHDATHIYAKDLRVGDVITGSVGEFAVATLEVVPPKGVGYSAAYRVNAGAADPITFEGYDRVVIKPRTA